MENNKESKFDSMVKDNKFFTENKEVVEEKKSVVQENLNEIYKTGVVFQCSALNIRKEPSVDAPVIGILNFKDEIEFTETDDIDWFKVKTEKFGDGYVMSTFISQV